METFIIYSSTFAVLGTVEHVSGERAVAKAEDAMDRDDLVWAAWKDGSAAEKAKALRLGSIT